MVFRHSTIYGSRQFSTYDQGWIGWFCSQVEKQSRYDDIEAFTISGNGKQVRDILYIEDFIDLYISAAENRSKVARSVFNVGGGMENSISILELLDYVSGRVGGHPPRYRSIDWRASDQKVFVTDIRRLGAALDWAPKVHWKSGVDAMLDWVKGID